MNINERLKFPLDEAVHSWLAVLLESYHIADTGIGEGIAREEKKGRRLACGKGCASCCRTHKDIPVYPIELVGMTWYATEKVEGDTRESLKQQLKDVQSLEGCPFLVDEACAIHPLRPLACRHFNVFNQVCEEGEDAFHTRRLDVLTPIRKYKDEALRITIPFYGVEKKSEQKKLLASGAINGLARAMKSCNWEAVSLKMDEFDQAHQ